MSGYTSGSSQSRKTKLVQRMVNSLGDVHREMNDTGASGNEVCLVVVPEVNVCCFSFLLQVPSGPNVLWSSFGANKGKLDPGMKKCWPVWRTVSALVSKQVVTYNAEAKRCPTRDNIYVDLDLSINFRIGPDIQRVQDFFFKMGPARLDAYFAFEVEEAIRTLVNGVKYEQVNDLRSEFATDMMQTLQSKIGAFGVDLVNVKVTDVHLPGELQRRLEETTSFSTLIAEEEKTHNFKLQQLINEHSQKMAAILQNTSIERQRIAAETARYEISQDEAMSVAESERKVMSETAKGAMDVAVTKGKGRVEVAQYEGRAEADKTVTSMSIKCENVLRSAQLEASTNVRHAEASKTSSTFLAQALLTSAQADGEAAAQLEEKLRFQHQLKLAEIDANLASKGRKFVSGSAGEGIMKSFVMVRDELS